ncbi:protein spartin [Culicoides brevitarsis]|uniref:protein spartin n=1 Tax=Culicoides brevitarsis TaxID=469753 RepID=UPI00307B1963
MTSFKVWQATYTCLKDTHDDAFKAVDRAIKLEELEKPELAIQEYKKAVTLIDRALNIIVEPPEELDDTWNEGVKMVNKMKSAREEILMRVAAVDKGIEKRKMQEKPVEINAVSTRPRTYEELAQALRDMQYNELNAVQYLELLFSCDEVKFYRIKVTGEVTSGQEVSTFRIVRLEKDDKQNLDSTIFLQVIPTNHATRIENAEEPLLELDEASLVSPEERPPSMTTSSCQTTEDDLGAVGGESRDPSWVYPIIPGVSPCYRTEYGAFIFPDLETNDGSAVGIVLPEGADQVVLEILVELLQGVMKKGGVIEFGDAEVTRVRRNVPVRVSETIVKGAYYISKGMIYSAEKTGEFLNYSTPYLISKIQKAEPNTQQPISGNVNTSIQVAKTVTGVAAKFTGYVAGKVGSATAGLGQWLAPHIQKRGSQLLTHSFGYDHDEANETMKDVLTIAAGAVEGFGTVYSGLENSASILGRSLSQNTVKVVEHRYGQEAGLATGDTFDTVGNVINLSRDINIFTPKGFAKKAVKNTGKAVVTDFLPRSDSMTASSSLTGINYANLSVLAKDLAKEKN